MDVTSLASNEMIPVGVAIIAINFTMLWYHGKNQGKEIENIKKEQEKLEKMIGNEKEARIELNNTIAKVLTSVEFIKDTLAEIKDKIK